MINTKGKEFLKKLKSETLFSCLNECQNRTDPIDTIAHLVYNSPN